MDLKWEHLKGNQIHGFSAYNEFIKNEKKLIHNIKLYELENY